MMGDPLHTILVERLGCRWPIIQTAMGWVAEPSLVIGSSNAGAFGFLGAAVMTPDEAREKILAVRQGTDRPFGVNFPASLKRPIILALGPRPKLTART